MAKFRRKFFSIIARLRNYFITGIVVLVPIGITLYLTKFFISISSKLIPYDLNPNNYLPFAIPGLEIVLSIIFITFVGGLSLSFIGKKILQIFNDLLKKIISHCKANGFVFQSSEIYDGLGAVYDYGPYGSELKNNLKEYWWKSMTQLNDNIVGLDLSLIHI